MDITPMVLPCKKVITGYGRGNFVISGESCFGSCIVFPNKIVSLVSFHINNIEQIIEFFDENLEVVIFGTGKKHLLPSAEVTEYLRRESFSVEFMSTGAACRTYNILLSEDRNVCAILIAL